MYMFASDEKHICSCVTFGLKNDHAYFTSLSLGQFPKQSPLTTENVKKNDFRTWEN